MEHAEEMMIVCFLIGLSQGLYLGRVVRKQRGQDMDDRTFLTILFAIGAAVLALILMRWTA